MKNDGACSANIYTRNGGEEGRRQGGREGCGAARRGRPLQRQGVSGLGLALPGSGSGQVAPEAVSPTPVAHATASSSPARARRIGTESLLDASVVAC